MKILFDLFCRAGDMVVLGAHDFNSIEHQHVSVKAVYSQAYDSSYPPLHDITLIYLSVPARLGTTPKATSSQTWSWRTSCPGHFGVFLPQIHPLQLRNGC